jgi:hypothetical protein
MVRIATAVVLAALLPSCVPELDDRSFLVTGPILLAIRSTPAEAAPPVSIAYDALYVDEHGPRTTDLSWAFCIARQALTDPGTVSPDCLEPSGAGLTPLGTGPAAGGPLPSDACRLFGPDSPDEVAGMPAGLPVAPDPTGGFYQPVRVLAYDSDPDGGGSETPSDVYSIGTTRIACGLAGGTAALSSQFAMSYRDNDNPAIASLSLVGANMTTPIMPAPPDMPGAAPGATVTPGESVTLHATWDPCTTAPMDCTGSELYWVYDLATASLVQQREVITVSWYATGGTLTDDISGRTAAEADSPSLDNPWIAPTQTGDVWVWLVVRDDRGGVGWQSYRIAVQ